MARRNTTGRRRGPEEIDRLDPSTESRETPEQASKRQERPGYRQQKRRSERRRRTVLGCLGALAITVLVVGIAVAAWLVKLQNMTDPGAKVISALGSKNDTIERTVKEPFWMVAVGVDTRPGETAARSDSILLTHVDPNKKRVTVISIPRDTRAHIEGHGTNKINTALFFNGPEGLIESVGELTGVQPTHYVAVDFSGFKEIVDAMGGVYVDVPSRIEDLKAANYDKTAYIVEAGYQKLDGKHALTFVRSRDYPQADLKRIESQQIFLRALGKQMLQLGNIFKAKGIMEAVARNTQTDLKITDLMSLGQDLMSMDENAIETVTLPGEPKYVGAVSYVIPDEAAIKKLIADVEAGVPVGSGAAAAAAATGTVTPAQVTITVRNGVGVAGIASDCAKQLEAKGYKITETGNAGQFVYDRTLIVWSGDNKRKAQMVREALGTGDIVESRGMYAFTSDVLVVVGKDWRASTPAGE